MPSPEEWVRRFWSAALFYRRATDRDRSTSIAVIRSVAKFATGLVSKRASHLMKEIDRERDTKPRGSD